MLLKNNAKKRNVIVFVLSILILVGLAFGILLINKDRKALADHVVDLEFNDTYMIDATIVVPNYTMIISDNQMFYSNDGYIIYPDGNAYALGKEFVLNKTGKYTLQFYFEKDSKQEIAEKTFTVLPSVDYSSDCTLSINLNYTPTSGDMVFSIVNKKVELFEAEVKGGNFSRLTKQVFYKYGTQEQVNIFTVDDAFIPEYTGEYTIIYKAFDIFGNCVVKEAKIFCVNENEMMTMDATSAMAKVNAVVGKVVQLPSVEELKIENLNKTPKIEIEAVFEPENERVSVNEQMQFIPTHVGVWKINYTVTDNMASIEKSYDLNVATTSELVYLGELLFEDIYIKNTEYTLDNYEAYIYNGKVRTPVTVDIATKYDGAGEYVKCASNNVKITGSKSVSFQYSYKGQILKTTEDFAIVDTGYGGPPVSWNICNYFKGNNIDISSTFESTSFVSKTTSGESAFSFIKEISFSNFMLDFAVMKDKTNYEGIKITFSDYYDKSNSFDLSILFGTDKTQLFLGSEGAVASKNSFDSATKLILNYDKASGYIALDTARLKLANPFSSDKCNIKITLLGMHGESGLNLFKINNQMVNQIRNDVGTPQIYVDREDSVRLFGDTVKIFVPDATDILSPIRTADVRVDVTAPDGSHLTSKEGVLLKNVMADKVYEVQFNEYGRFLVTYTVTDQNGKITKEVVNYLVIDTVAPTIEFTGSVKVGDVLNGKLGETHTFEQTDCKDNIDDDLSPLAYVISPTQKIVMLSDKSFTPTEKGIYKIYLRVDDSSFNSDSVYYYLNVLDSVN